MTGGKGAQAARLEDGVLGQLGVLLQGDDDMQSNAEQRADGKAGGQQEDHRIPAQRRKKILRRSNHVKID